jgi:hypothetical protein
MHIIYQQQTGGGCRYNYHTDRTKPHDKGKYIGGLANTVAKIKKSVRSHLGHARFTIERVVLPNEKS